MHRETKRDPRLMSNVVCWTRLQLKDDLVKPWLRCAKFNALRGEGVVLLHRMPDPVIDSVDCWDRLIDSEELGARLLALIDYRLEGAEKHSFPERVWSAFAEDAEMKFEARALKLWDHIMLYAFAGVLPRFKGASVEKLLLATRDPVFEGEPHEQESAPALQPALQATTRVRKRKAPMPSLDDEDASASASASASLPDVPGTLQRNSQTAVPLRKEEPVSQLISPPRSASESDGNGNATPGPSQPTGPARRTRGLVDAGGNVKKQSTGPTLFGERMKAFFAWVGKGTDNLTAFAQVPLPDNGPAVILTSPDKPEELKDADLKKWLAKTNDPEDRQWTLHKPRGDLGDFTGVHESEIRLCELLGIKAAQYKCQKQRHFLGLAMFIEWNSRLPAGGKFCDYAITQCQYSCSMDVNKLSQVSRFYKEWGWDGPRMTGPTVPEELLTRYPEEFRLGWLKAMQEWERDTWLPTAMATYEADKEKPGMKELEEPTRSVCWDLGP